MFPPLGDENAFIRCDKTTRAGRATEYHCAGWLATTNLITSIYSFSGSQKSAEAYLLPMIHQARSALLLADS
ncbi:hypothetical protein F4553_002576 [Allocatelliglobosispora scoriae]|uniref:Uncharacterized protein n=1 Tax=Allocatelliglobosispora scoriae TaxID=643052 RepID=A0A841BJA8_9ACTN|nr:hypothetical protein [Allocatelliglobosispora scoriae]MBB5869197.1 hypothetical protein [Allocatelliglobosispora scoriae]